MEMFRTFIHQSILPVRTFVGRVLSHYYASKGKVVVDLNIDANNYAVDALPLIRQIKKEREMVLRDKEALLIYTTLRLAKKIPGDVAEVGVYQGGSAKLMRHASQKRLHLFDTFEGLPEVSQHDDAQQFKEGEYAASYEDVSEYLKEYKEVFFHKGLFPGTAEVVKDSQFSFVHFDVDLYDSVKDCLNFFYPRLSVGGVIISHDYPSAKGVKKAFDEFFQDKSEIIFNPAGTNQALVVKVGNH